MASAWAHSPGCREIFAAPGPALNLSQAVEGVSAEAPAVVSPSIQDTDMVCCYTLQVWVPSAAPTHTPDRQVLCPPTLLWSEV